MQKAAKGAQSYGQTLRILNGHFRLAGQWHAEGRHGLVAMQPRPRQAHLDALLLPRGHVRRAASAGRTASVFLTEVFFFVIALPFEFVAVFSVFFQGFITDTVKTNHTRLGSK